MARGNRFRGRPPSDYRVPLGFNPRVWVWIRACAKYLTYLYLGPFVTINPCKYCVSLTDNPLSKRLRCDICLRSWNNDQCFELKTFKLNFGREVEINCCRMYFSLPLYHAIYTLWRCYRHLNYSIRIGVGKANIWSVFLGQFFLYKSTPPSDFFLCSGCV